MYRTFYKRWMIRIKYCTKIESQLKASSEKLSSDQLEASFSMEKQRQLDQQIGVFEFSVDAKRQNQKRSLYCQ